MILSVWLPAVAGRDVLENAIDFLGTEPRGARIQPVSAIAIGLIGGYIVLFAGVLDMERSGVNPFLRRFIGILWLPILAFMTINDQFDVFSIMVEYDVNGENLWQDTLRHITFVIVSLFTGLVIGVTLGLWSSRDERISPVVMYAVGIIQTIPSLALFGVLLVPLSNLGDTNFLSILGTSLAVLGAVISVGYLIFVRLGNVIPAGVTLFTVAIWGAIFAIPLGLLTLMLNSFLFRITFDILTEDQYVGLLQLIAVGLAIIGFSSLSASGNDSRQRTIQIIRRIAIVGVGLVTLYVLFQSASDYLPNTSVSDWQLRDIGIAGIGIAPTLVALTLYSLLPLTRNTYVGLSNVDPAIIDSGKGMGMTPRQIFFQIELPLAFPVIMAGIRNAGVSLIGIATIATVIGGGGLGDYVLNGITNVSVDSILLGTLPAIALAILLDTGLLAFENFFVSQGIRRDTVAS